jgi:hypothetical protein
LLKLDRIFAVVIVVILGGICNAQTKDALFAPFDARFFQKEELRFLQTSLAFQGFTLAS